MARLTGALALGLTFMSPIALASPEVLDLGSTDVNGQVRRPLVDTLEGDSAFRKQLSALTWREFQRLEAKVLKTPARKSDVRAGE
jgi:hypothetical protein